MEMEMTRVDGVFTEPLFSERDIQTRVRQLGEMLTKEYLGEEVIFLVVLKGAMMFAADLMRWCYFPIQLEFTKIRSYQARRSGPQTVTTGYDVDILLPTFANRHIVIIEDIVDTGKTVHALINGIEDLVGVKSVRVCTLLNKMTDRRIPYPIDFVGVGWNLMEDKFVAGYGMDYEERFRNCPFVFNLDDRKEVTE